MTATTFNPLATARTLKAAGIEATQAEAIAEGMREAAAGADFADSAAKADLAGFETRLMKTFATKADLHREIGTLRSELRWTLGVLAALLLAIAAKLFGIV